MANVSREEIGKALVFYKPEQKFLLKANVEYPEIKGEFRINSGFYTLQPLEHATDIEIQLCLNQLAYLQVLNAINSGLPEFQELNFDELQREGMVILRSDKRFRRRIENGKIIHGRLVVDRVKRTKSGLFGKATFDFENGSCIGNLELAAINHNT